MRVRLANGGAGEKRPPLVDRILPEQAANVYCALGAPFTSSTTLTG
jgi:hypothetical protein